MDSAGRRRGRQTERGGTCRATAESTDRGRGDVPGDGGVDRQREGEVNCRLRQYGNRQCIVVCRFRQYCSRQSDSTLPTQALRQKEMYQFTADSGSMAIGNKTARGWTHKGSRPAFTETASRRRTPSRLQPTPRGPWWHVLGAVAPELQDQLSLASLSLSRSPSRHPHSHTPPVPLSP